MNSSIISSKELNFNINDLTISAQRFGKKSKNKFLCLHGWLDNSSSFELLSSHLKNAEIIAIDLAGHGKSSHRCAHGSYNIWDDLIDLISIIKLLQWKDINLIGHSRGGIVSILLSIVNPELISKLILLDSILTVNKSNKDSPDTLKKFLLDQYNLFNKKKKIYSDKDKMIEKRLSKMSLKKEEISSMMDRSINSIGENKFIWNHDPRILGSSAFKLNDIHVSEFLNKFVTPTLLIKAKNGILKKTDLPSFEMKKNVRSINHNGSHHMHMEFDNVESISKLIYEFTNDL